MTLPKKGTRMVQAGGKPHRWKVGKADEHDNANISVETPSGGIWQFRTKVGEGNPVTPALVRGFIQERLGEDGVRFFSVHSTHQGLLTLAEHRGYDDAITALPARLPIGTALKDEEGVTWVVLRIFGKRLALNRKGAAEGLRFFLYPKKGDVPR